MKLSFAFIRKKFSWSGLSLLIIAVALIWSMLNIKLWKVGKQNLDNTHGIIWKQGEMAPEPRSVINHDVTNYYCYLPAAFIHQDLTFNFVHDDIQDFAKKRMYWPIPVEEGEGHLIKMSMGLSYLYMPFFLMAHAYTKSFSEYPADGFSPPYEFFIALSSIFYLIIGFFFLRRLLLRYFKDGVVAVVMLLTIFGTNLYYYGTSEPGMSHAYSFSLFAIFAYLSVVWIYKPTWKKAILIGLVGGLIVLIRPVNILIFIFPLLIEVKSVEELKKRFSLIFKNYVHLLLLIASAFIVIFPQLLFWKMNSGSWVYYSYNDEHFFFGNPHIYEGLFSYRKGWLVYTPIMLFALFGTVVSFFKRKDLFWYIIIYFPIHIYVTYSWWCWWYGGSFGSRPMIETYALLSLSLGVWIDWIGKNVASIVNFGLVAVLLVALNLFQTARYRYGSIHYHGMTKEAYWMNFGYRDPVPGYWDRIHEPNYDRAKEGEDEYYCESVIRFIK